MKKGKSILSLILVIAVTALFGMTCVLGLDLKGMGAAKNINLGLDLEGGVSITYQVKGDKPSQADMDDTRIFIRESFCFLCFLRKSRNCKT